MSINELIAPLLATVNEILAAGIVILAASLLLYNLTRDLNNRIARTSGIVLFFVTIVYLVDIFLALQPDVVTSEAAARLQWIGIAFIPAALFHLSHDLLATTGLPSRGRRRIVVRLLYLLSSIFLVGATLTDWVAVPLVEAEVVQMQARAGFIVFVAYFITAAVATVINVNRARKRALTTSTTRRMAYLQVGILTPALGVFPYSALLPAGEGFTLTVQLLVNIANMIVLVMLLFLSYPLSFFGSNIPDRVVKVDLLRFLLRGPATGLLALAVVILTSRATEILSLPGQELTPFAVVTVVLLWQWAIHLGLPLLERWIVYGDEDDEQLSKLQDLSDRLLTRNDLQQLIEATLEASCDYLRSERAFVLALTSEELPFITTGGANSETVLSADQRQTLRRWVREQEQMMPSVFQPWDSYQVIPLYSKRITTENDSFSLLGVLGIEAEDNPFRLLEAADVPILQAFVQRVEQTLDDMLLQGEIFAALEGLLPQISITRPRADEVEYRPGHTRPQPRQLPSREEVYEQVRAALRHYWGGPGIVRSRLLELNVVQQKAQEADTPVQALRTVLQDALAKLRPEGTRTMTAAEWTIYNILDLRFIEGKKVRDVARRLSISEPDLYRKQRIAIQTLADTLLDMEREALNP